MKKDQRKSSLRLLYSYSHKDAKHRDSMEKALALLKRNRILEQWSDRNILPGLNITPEVRKGMDEADIIVFLLSPDFIASEACMNEWEYAATLTLRGKPLFRIPIILRECAWKDLLGDDDLKALPDDAKPVVSFEDEDIAWQQVYEGIKSVANQLKRTFSPKVDFLEEIEKTDFISESHLKLQDIFTFLRMTVIDSTDIDQLTNQKSIVNQSQLLEIKYALIHGREKAGKTALARHVFLSLVEDSKPVVLVNSAQVGNQSFETLIQEIYQRQFYGDFTLWAREKDKTLILDNLTDAPDLLDLIVEAKAMFKRIIITLSSDFFYSYFRDESRLGDFRQLQIEPLTRSQQESLIRKRLKLANPRQPLTDEYVDQIEAYVNSAMVSQRLLPRYPFYVLSILQTYEAYMPTNLAVTSYGNCYFALIIANILRAGISHTDDAINACFNFAEHLAFAIFNHREQNDRSPFDRTKFVEHYKEQFFIRDSIFSRLQHKEFGILNENGLFKTEYMYYFFLGKFLAGHKELGKRIITKMCEESYREANYLTLLFTIHHTNEDYIIDEILSRTMTTLTNVPPAVLNLEETRRFGDIVAELPASILSSASVEQERMKERNLQDQIDGNQLKIQQHEESLSKDHPGNMIYRVFKGNSILGQILRNRHGNLERAKVEEIIRVIADSGLRLVNLILQDEDEIARLAHYFNTRYPEWDMEKVKHMLQYFSFLWAMVNVEQIVDAINLPEIREAVNNVVDTDATPAYDLIGYFSQLDSSQQLSNREREKLAGLLKKHRDIFVRRVLSIRTQYYMNTHHSSARVQQSICSLLEIKYVYRAGWNRGE